MGLSYWQYGLRENVEGRCRGQRFWGGRKKKSKVCEGLNERSDKRCIDFEEGIEK